MKTLQCKEVGFDCSAVVKAASEEEILSQAAQYAKLAHGVIVTAEMVEHIKTLIHEE